MRHSWLLMFLSALFLPITGLVGRQPGTCRSLHALESRIDSNQHRSEREVRGYEVIIDHEQREIHVRTYFFAMNQDPRAQRQLEGILAYWNDQNGKFGYRLGKGKHALTYDIVFDVQEAPGIYLSNGFFVPSPSVDHALINQIQVVEAHCMPAACEGHGDGHRHVHVIGYSPENFIYISEHHADHAWVGIHEAGHRLGAGHQPGLMAANILDRQNHLSKHSVREILSGADIWGRYPISEQHLAHRVMPHRKIQIGEPPQGFFLGGKVKRL